MRVITEDFIEDAELQLAREKYSEEELLELRKELACFRSFLKDLEEGKHSPG